MITSEPAMSADRATTGEVGTVETLAGPGYCRLSGHADPSSLAVGALAVADGGTYFFEAGTAVDGSVVMVSPGGQVKDIPTGLPGDDEKGPGLFLARLGADEALVANSKEIMVLGLNGVTTLGGGPIPAPSGRIRAIATDTGGKVFIAESSSATPDEVTVRLLNRGASPVALFEGSGQQQTVMSGQIASVGVPDAAAVRAPVLAAPETDRVSLSVAADRLYLATSPRGGRKGGDVGLAVMNMGGSTQRAHGVELAAAEYVGIVDAGVRNGENQPDGRVAPVPDSIWAISATEAGRLYLADAVGHRVLSLDDGDFAAVAGAGVAGFDGNDRPALSSRLKEPVDVQSTPDGRLFIADRGNGMIRVVDAAGVIRAAPGAGLERAVVCDGGGGGGTASPTESSPGGPSDVATDESGNVYASLADANVVVRIEPSGTVFKVAGGGGEGTCLPAPGCPGFSGDGSAATAAQLDAPASVAIGSPASLYVLDAGNRRVRLVNLGDQPLLAHGVRVPPGGIETVVGNGSPGFGGDGGPARDAELGAEVDGFGKFDYARLGDLASDGYQAIESALNEGRLPGALAVDPQGNLFIADAPNQRVRRVDATGVISTALGEAAPGALAECCREPRGLAFDNEGNLYVADTGDARIWFANFSAAPIIALGREVAPGQVVGVAGGGNVAGGAEQSAQDARLILPADVALDRAGNLYVADLASAPDGGALYRVNPAGSIVQLMGTGQSGFNGDGLKASLTSVTLPSGLAVDRCGNLLIADAGSDRVRRLLLVGPCPTIGRQEPPSSGTPVVGLVLAAVVGLGLAVLVFLDRLRRQRR